LTKKYKRLREHELLILNDLLSHDAEDETIEILDTIAAPDDTLAEVEDSVFLQEALALLTSQQQKVIVATVLEGRTEQEVAEQLGIEQQVVNRLKSRGVKRLKKYFALDEPTAK
jgi:RNA polymerase sigma-B factor